MTVGLVLLTRNEIEGVSALIDRIARAGFDERVAVDAKSKDGTGEFLASRGYNVLSQENRGRGDAFRLAWGRTSSDALVFFSPDGNEDPADLPRFRPLLEQGSDLVIASRMTAGARNEEDDQAWRARKWANLSFTWIANRIWNRGPYVTDTINGYRALTRRAWNELRLDSLGFAIEYQMSIRAMKLGLKVAEFPTSEGPRIGGESGSKSIPTGLLFLKLLAREIAAGRRF